MNFSSLFLLISTFNTLLLGMVDQQSIPPESSINFTCKKAMTHLDLLPEGFKEILKTKIIEAHSDAFKQLHPPTCQPIGVRANVVTATPDCARVIMGYDNGIKLFDRSTGRCIIFPNFTGKVGCADISSDGTGVVTGTLNLLARSPENGTALFWNLSKMPKDATESDRQKSIVSSVLDHTNVHLVKISSNAQRVVTCSIDGTSKVWDLSDSAHPTSFPLLAHTVKPTLRKHQVNSKNIPHIDLVSLVRVTSIALSQDGTKLLMGYADGTVNFYDLSDLAHVHLCELEGHILESVLGASLTPDCHFGLTVVLKESTILWDLRNLSQIKGYRVNDQNHDRNTSTLPVADTASLLNPCYQTIIYNLEDIPHVSVFKSNYHAPSAQSSSLSTSNRWGLFVNTDDGKVLLVNLLNLNTYTLKGPTENTGRDRGFNIFAKMSSDGRYAVTSLNTVEFWDLFPSQDRPLEEIIGLAANFEEDQASTEEAATSLAQVTESREALVLATLSDEYAQRAFRKIR